MQAAPIVLAAGSTVSGFGIDDNNFADTFDATYVSDTSGILAALRNAGFNPSNYVVAGAPGPAAGIAPISPLDLSVPVYAPWVVNNNPTNNNLVAPNGRNYNRGVTGQDAGGADFLMYYTPTFRGDPTTVNFIQGFAQETNFAGFGPPTLDNFGSTVVPYYNNDGHAAGVGTITGVFPLIIPPGGTAWLADIPYRCENGPPPYTETTNCQIGKDETILDHFQVFLTVIEAPAEIDGTTYNVLYGGVSWGYHYRNEDLASVPEPGSLLLMAAGLATLAAWAARRCR
jgi:hypothetical protein